MFMIEILFKGCQGRSNCSSIVHAVSYFACGVNDPECTRACDVNDIACILIFFTYHRRFACDFHFSKLFENFLCMRCQ
jgi:hypothetical protein